MNPPANEALYERIYLVVEQIPRGQVATYGEIATILGGGVDARTVGYALGDLPQARTKLVPWQRVISRDGAISTRGLAQRAALEAEGIAFDAHDHVIMAHFQWDGPDPAWAAAHGLQPLPPRDEADRSEQLSLL